MKVKKTKIKNHLFILIILFFFLCLPYFALAGQFDYQPLEKIPGSETQDLKDFYNYISAIYKLGLWAVGIAALLMIVIGGFMYITSAGNNASMEKAKGVITDAIAGLILALVSWLILYTINPALVEIPRIAPTSIMITSGLLPTDSRIGTGRCMTAGSGSCSIENLKSKSKCFTTNLLAYKASYICQAESASNETKLSAADKCKDGTSFSVGLFQINLFAHGGKIGSGSRCAPSNLFNKFGSGAQGTCLEKNSTGTACIKYDCTLKNTADYTYCSGLLMNPATNIQLACDISSSGTTWRPWGANSLCGF